MFKHANTLETGDEVRHVDAQTDTDGKMASAPGKIVGADPSQEQFSVKWADGVVSWHTAAQLKKVDSDLR